MNISTKIKGLLALVVLSTFAFSCAKAATTTADADKKDPPAGTDAACTAYTEIKSAVDLGKIAASPACNFRLSAPLDLSETDVAAAFSPIGTEVKADEAKKIPATKAFAFSGTLDGNGKKITLTKPLFANLGTATKAASIRNVTLELKTAVAVAGKYSGLLAATVVDADITDVRLTAAAGVGFAVDVSVLDAGSLVGTFTKGTISKTSSNVYVTSAGVAEQSLGGLVGNLKDGTIKASFYGGKVTGGTATAAVGGLVGKSAAGVTLEGVYATYYVANLVPDAAVAKVLYDKYKELYDAAEDADTANAITADEIATAFTNAKADATTTTNMATAKTNASTIVGGVARGLLIGVAAASPTYTNVLVVGDALAPVAVVTTADAKVGTATSIPVLELAATGATGADALNATAKTDGIEATNITAVADKLIVVARSADIDAKSAGDVAAGWATTADAELPALAPLKSLTAAELVTADKAEADAAAKAIADAAAAKKE